MHVILYHIYNIKKCDHQELTKDYNDMQEKNY